MYSSRKRSIRRNTTWSAIYFSLQRNIPKFDTVLLHLNWSSLRRKYLSKIPTDVNAVSCGPKTWKISGISDAISPARHPQKSSQHVRACATGDGAICSKNSIVPHHGDNPILEMARAYGLRPRLWLLVMIRTLAESHTSTFNKKYKKAFYFDTKKKWLSKHNIKDFHFLLDLPRHITGYRGNLLSRARLRSKT